MSIFRRLFAQRAIFARPAYSPLLTPHFLSYENTLDF